MLEVPIGVDTETTTLAWLVSALEQARTGSQVKLVDYLETIADEVVFEVEMAARRASLLSNLMQDETT